MRWGFPPPAGVKAPVVNVRNYGSPFWRSALANPARRCLVPVTAFQEWSVEPDPTTGKKRPHWFAVPAQPIFAIGGFWQRTAKGPGFSMVTCDPNELVAPIHPKAMVTILHEADWERWLTGTYDDVVALQRPYPADEMTVRGPVFPTREKATA